MPFLKSFQLGQNWVFNP